MAREPKPGFIVGDSIADILAYAGIRQQTPAAQPGRNVKWLCPSCEGGRTRERSLSVRVDPDGMGVAWHCKRGTCPGGLGAKGSGRIEGTRDERPQRREPRKVVYPTEHVEQQRSEALYGWFARRGITRETVDEFGVYGRKERWPIKGEDGQTEWVEKPTIVFPYRRDGKLVSRKFRSIDKQFRQDKDSLRSLFNVDAITASDECIFVEGELDVMALWEAGFRQVVSLPDGAASTLRDESDPERLRDDRFLPLEICADKIGGLERCIIATDADVPGQYLAEEFARRLGRGRCWRVQWPEGCKDANDVLLRHAPKGQEPTPEQLEAGRADLRRCIEQARPWPLAGIVIIEPGQLSAFLRSGQGPQGFSSGIAAMDRIARLPVGGGWLTVVTGVPSHGKTSAMRAWLTYTAQKHDLGIVWCSPEDNRAETVALEIARIIAGQPLKEAGTYIPESVLAECEEWIARRVSFLQSNDPDTEMTLEWVLARAEEAKARQKRQLLVLDPWNEFEHQFGKNETETQYTGRWLRRLKAWGRAEGMSVLIVAHPKNQVRDPKTKQYPVVDGYDISGGANWNNKADLGLTVYRRDEGIVEVHTWKARFKAFGERSGVARMKLDQRTGRLHSMDSADQPEEQAA